MRLAAALLITLLVPAAARAEHPLAKRYLDGLFKAKPHLASFMGDHRFDGAMPDYAPATLQKREAELAALQKELAATKVTALDDQIDAEILADAIGLELLYLREIRDWEWDPRLFDSFPVYDPREIVADRLSMIMHAEHGTEAERRAAVTSQLAGLPKFLAGAEAALLRGARHVPPEYLTQSQKANQGRIDFVKTEVAAYTAKDPAAEKARKEALAALEKYQAFLGGPALKARADGDFRLGKALYEKKFPLALGTKLTPDEALVRADAAFKAARKELETIAYRLHDKLWPKEPKLAGKSLYPEAAAALVRRVNDELAKSHPKPADLVDAHCRNLEALRAFLVKHDLIELPAKETLLCGPMPGYKRGSIAAEYLAPYPLDKNPSWHATYSVDPIDPTWSADRVESYLRGQNDYEVQLVAAHEAYPGHHTQYFYSRKNPNPLRAVHWNAPMVEGWAVYGEGQIVDKGWGGADNDRFRFYDVRGRMITATNIILDIKLHRGQMTDAEALKLMIEDGFQPQAMADKKLLRAKLDSTQLAQYFLGLDEILGLEADARKTQGGKFTQKGFNEALIGHGSIAIRFVRRYLLSREP